MKINKHKTAVICLSPSSGGMELASIKLAKILSKYIDVTFIAQKDSFLHKQCRTNNDYKSLKSEMVTFSTNLSLSLIFQIRKIIKDKNIKNVIFVGASELKSLYFSFLGLDINLIVRHGTTKSTPKKDFFHKLVYSEITYHVALSKHLLQNVKTIVPFGKNTKSTIIVPSMPKACANLQKEKHSKLRLLHVARITPGKGLKEALQACSILEKNNINFEFDCYGNIADDYKVEFENFIQTLPYKEKLNLGGFTNNIYEQYVKHDIFIFPTKGEGFGNVFMEAISHGIICLAFDNTAITNFKEMGFHIHLVEDANVDALSKKLLYIAKNLEEEKQLAKKNIKLAKQIFSSKREVEGYLKLLI